jgi:hypothetical protein
MRLVIEVIGAVALILVALLGGRVLLDARTSVAGAPGSPPARTGDPTPPIDARDQAPPLGGALPSPAASWQARDGIDAAANMARDPFATQQLLDITRPGSPIHDPAIAGPVRLGAPIFVKAYRQPSADIWLTPVLSGAKTVAVLVASLRPDGTAAADFYSGFAGLFPNALTQAEALAAASAGSDAGVSAELMWSNIGSRQGYPTGIVHPFWRVVRASGTEALVLTDGTVVTSDQLK